MEVLMGVSFHPFPVDRASRPILLAFLVAAGVGATATLGCGGDGSTNASGAGGNGSGAGSGGGSGGFFNITTGSNGSGTGLVPDPSSFVDADVGSYALGEPVTDEGIGNTGIDDDDGCNILVGVVRDFKGADEPGGHPDFQAFSGTLETPGLVGANLANNQKPVYTSGCEAPNPAGNCPFGPQTTSEENFDLWYRYSEQVNKPYLIYFKFAPNGDVVTFESTRFFPLDGAGWGNSGNDIDDVSRNFHFTTELHTRFKYKGGEQFSFSGDDDLWVFINKRLALDLGGLHPAVTATVDLDASAADLGITPGEVYSLELFHAERHTSESNFRVDTNLTFVSCGEIIPDPK
jgi:fibro-slime domain-containing protein